MKKTYSKPVIVFESFKMTSSIANNCGEYKANHGDGYECTLDVYENGFTYIVFDDTDCNTNICYHVPNLTATIVAS